MATNLPQDSKAADAPKHRACDECRARKLACSKDPSGCERCKREGITCVYSPQKPMGRPRKRRAAEEPIQDDASSSIDTTRPSVSHTPGEGTCSSSSLHHEEPLTTNNTGLDFLPQLGDENGVTYLDLLPNNFGDNDTAHLYSLPQQPYQPFLDSGDAGFPNHSYQLDFGGPDLLQGINFNEPEPIGSTISKDINDSLHQYVAGHIPRPDETPPSISSGMSSSVESPEPAHEVQSSKALPNSSCGCLSSLYLALDSLTRLPSDVPSAMRVARSATKIAHDVLGCPQCFQYFHKDPLQPQPVQSFQNMTCLGALVPSACNAYARIMEMIDRDADAASDNDKDIYFSFRDFGGFWGFVMDDQGACSVLKAYDNRNLDPEVWRTTVRSVLKLDVYGLGGKTGASPTGHQAVYGLKDVINELDRSTKLRHKMMEDLVAEGKVPNHSKYYLHCNAPIPPEHRNCTRLIESARVALDNLIIS
ncbi:C6 finger domain-containing protein [Pochonia chlamydosporia 170]|uniref:C6 finger domain-containing protein n=1 Tax=Pochonia chlamydosporia 170 TaxID=1380566 RepID=A0A179G5C3_METCM|nr:C6 finger domain-containing protein [Pochonia chlamydosporia 170]OAQ72678.1 C6 finger domain-containing protein [Pochonia chlamydosporia 170]